MLPLEAIRDTTAAILTLPDHTRASACLLVGRFATATLEVLAGAHWRIVPCGPATDAIWQKTERVLSAAGVCASASEQRWLSPASRGPEHDPALHLSGFRRKAC